MKDPAGYRVWLKPYIWNPSDEAIHGIALMRGKKVRHFIPADQAIELADRLIYLSEELEQQKEETK